MLTTQRKIVQFHIWALLFTVIGIHGCRKPSEMNVMTDSQTPHAHGGAEEHNALKANPKFETASFAAGCFWGTEAEYQKIEGVISTAVGFSNGTTTNPTYEEICRGNTGHAESLEVVFDPKVVPYEKLVDVFWTIHDPTTPNRQGPDIGTQYRSAIFYTNDKQKAAAIAAFNTMQMSDKYSRPIVTEITKAEPFYRAEEYHQKYLEKRGEATCRIP